MTIQLPDSVRSALEEIGRREKRSVEDVPGRLVEEAVALLRMRQWRQERRPDAERAGFQTEQDLFRAVS